MTVRLKRKRTKGWRMPPGAKYVGRPTKWGNPFRGPNAIGEYESWLQRYLAKEIYPYPSYTTVAITIDWLVDLQGHDLACWCALCPIHADGLPLGVECPDCAPCHADVLLRLVNA